MKYIFVILCIVLASGCGGEGEKHGSAGDYKTPLELGMVPEIVNRPSFTVVGMKINTDNQQGEIRGLWDQFLPRMLELKHAIRDGNAYGVISNFTPPVDTSKSKIGKFDYLVGIEVTSADDIPDRMEFMEIPAQTYAVFTFRFSKLLEIYNYALDVWLPRSEYVYGDGPEFELYPPGFGSEADSEMMYYIPVRKR